MSYKTELQSNNVDLQGILDKVNALPEMEEAPELPTLSNPAAAAQILSGYEVLDQHGIKLTGIMEDNGAVSQTLNAGGSYTIPAGYHNGSGKVTGNSLASQTSANAAAGDIASGKTAWVNGAKVTGTLVVPTGITLTNTGKRLSNRSDLGNQRFWQSITGTMSSGKISPLSTTSVYGLSGLTTNKCYYLVYSNRVVGYGFATSDSFLYYIPCGDVRPKTDYVYEEISPYNIYLYTA